MGHGRKAYIICLAPWISSERCSSELPWLFPITVIAFNRAQDIEGKNFKLGKLITPLAYQLQTLPPPLGHGCSGPLPSCLAFMQVTPVGRSILNLSSCPCPIVDPQAPERVPNALARGTRAGIVGPKLILIPQLSSDLNHVLPNCPGRPSSTG